jgi:hypothetical protein
MMMLGVSLAMDGFIEFFSERAILLCLSLGGGPFTRLRRKPRLPVLRSSLLRRMEKAVGLHQALRQLSHI